MSKQPKDKTRKEYKGERNAMSGYWPQYKEFGIRAYDALRAGDLVEVRVADLEENVGKLSAMLRKVRFMVSRLSGAMQV